MKKFQTVTSRVIPLPVKDVDTDMIIPAQFLTSVSRDGYGENAFRRLKDADPNFPLNLAEYDGAKVLVADHNFGCGSSREHAVWAIAGAGIEVVIAKSFADIFSGNSAKNGLLLVTLPDAVVDRILSGAAEGVYQVTVDLQAETVTLQDGAVERFSYDPFRKHCLLEGLDDIDYIRSKQGEIVEFRKRQEGTRYFTTLQANN